MKVVPSFVLLTFCAAFLRTGEPVKILGLFTAFCKSHLLLHMPLIETLVERGHNVTVVTILPINNPSPKYRHILLDVPKRPKGFIGNIIQSSQSPLSMIRWTKQAAEITMIQTNASLHEPQMKKLMAEESFDLVIFGYFFNAFQLGVAAHFKCPVAVSFIHQPMRLLQSIVGNPIETFYVPHMSTGLVQPLGFFDRVQNVMANVIDYALFSIIEYQMEEYYDSNFPSSIYPSYKDMLKNISLVLTCSHFTNSPVRPYVPGVVEIGGIQVKPKPNQLPEDIQKFLDDASKVGAVYFSLGSNARSADMGSEIISMLYNVLASLKQRVIWKWEEDVTPGNASNILFKRWLPQDDILAHPNVKLFVTHGGHGSVVESEYHGVPMVGMPLFADQFSNMDAVQKAGYGLSLGKGDITEEKFRNALKEVLENPEYRNKVQEFSRLYRDRPMSARDTAAFWLEYVIRHRGAKHMQSPAVHMNFIQYYGIDVFAFLFAIVYVVFKTIAFVFRRIFRLIFGRKTKKSKKE